VSWSDAHENGPKEKNHKVQEIGECEKKAKPRGKKGGRIKWNCSVCIWFPFD